MNPEQSIQEYYQNLTDKHNSTFSTQPDPHKQLLENFKQINRSIQQRLEHFCKLTNDYTGKIETSFLVTFSKVLQKMGNDLMLAEEAYKNINKEIMEKERCVNLNQDKLFFIQESTYYKQEFQFKSKEADQLKEKSFLLIKQNTGLKEKLFDKIQQIMSLKQRCKKLEKINLQNQSQTVKPQNNKETQKPRSPQKIANNMSKTHHSNRNQRKWASLGKQTEEQKRRKEQEKSKQKNDLFTDIRKDLKTRERINLDAIINRSIVQDSSREVANTQFRSRKKRVHLDLLNGSKTTRLADVVKNTVEIPLKGGYDSTVASQFEMTFNNTLSGKRSLHTSGERNVRQLKA